MSKNINKIIDLFSSLNFKKIYLISCLLLIPYYLCLYPGLIITDSASSIIQLYGIKIHEAFLSNTPDNLLTNHHIILFTYLMGGCVKLGDLLGSQNIGYFFYIIIQSLFINFSFIEMLKIIKEKTNNKIYFWSFIFISLFPIINIWKVTMSKDSLFSTFVLLFVVNIYKCIDSNFKLIENKDFLFKFFLISLGLVFTKQQGSYILLLCSIVFLIIYRNKIIKLSLIIVISSLIYLVLLCNIILPTLNISVSGKQEMMGFMFQQTARYVIDNNDELTDDEITVINNVLPFDELENLYTPHRQDSVKFNFKQNSTNYDIKNYFIVWFKMFFKHPESYLKATFYNCQGYFIPRGYPFDPGDSRSYLPPSLNDCSLLLQNEHIFSLNNSSPLFIYGINILKSLNNVPLLSYFCFPFIYIWIFMLSMFMAIKKHRINIIVSSMPLIISLFILVICPDVEVRYVLPFIFSLPLITTMAFN